MTMTSTGPTTRFYGKYRGTVADNNDPLNKARLRLEVPDVLGEVTSGWALPCLPFTADGPDVRASPQGRQRLGGIRAR